MERIPIVEDYADMKTQACATMGSSTSRGCAIGHSQEAVTTSPDTRVTKTHIANACHFVEAMGQFLVDVLPAGGAMADTA
jgi:hypothetical protein